MESNKTYAKPLTPQEVESAKRTFINEKRLKRGHTLFRFDFNTGLLEAAVMGNEVKTEKHELPEIELKKGQRRVMTGPMELETNRRSVIFEVGSYYFGALNIANAQKHLRKFLPNIEFKKQE